jgi:branched-chain amino acid transport system ATP-binding protein
VAQGEIVALLGNNGAGKTTTLKTISGLLRPRVGQVLLEGRPIHALPPHDIVARGVAHSPEGRKIFNRLTVTENLEMGAYLRGDSAVREDVDRPELFASPRAPPAGGGTLGRRAADAGHGPRDGSPAILLRPPPRPARSSWNRRDGVDINRQGTTILLVEQNAAIALSVAHRAYVLETGSVALTGAAVELA